MKSHWITMKSHEIYHHVTTLTIYSADALEIHGGCPNWPGLDAPGRPKSSWLASESEHRWGWTNIRSNKLDGSIYIMYIYIMYIYIYISIYIYIYIFNIHTYVGKTKTSCDPTFLWFFRDNLMVVDGEKATPWSWWLNKLARWPMSTSSPMTRSGLDYPWAQPQPP